MFSVLELYRRTLSVGDQLTAIQLWLQNRIICSRPHFKAIISNMNINTLDIKSYLWMTGRSSRYTMPVFEMLSMHSFAG
jgi:hypothetical protein